MGIIGPDGVLGRVAIWNGAHIVETDDDHGILLFASEVLMQTSEEVIHDMEDGV